MAVKRSVKYRDMSSEQKSRFLIGLLGRIRDDLVASEAAAVLVVAAVGEDDVLEEVRWMSNIEGEDEQAMFRFLAERKGG